VILKEKFSLGVLNRKENVLNDRTGLKRLNCL